MDYLLNFNTTVTNEQLTDVQVLNLIINGLPSKPKGEYQHVEVGLRFKPYYKWITF